MGYDGIFGQWMKEGTSNFFAWTEEFGTRWPVWRLAVYIQLQKGNFRFS